VTELEALRSEIDAVDEELVDALARRFEIVSRVAEYKSRTGTPMMQSDRVREVGERTAALAQRHGLDPAMVRRLFDLLIEETCAYEDRRIAEATTR
jgi:4-amino-4-deoxychorismate mutase